MVIATRQMEDRAAERARLSADTRFIVGSLPALARAAAPARLAPRWGLAGAPVVRHFRTETTPFADSRRGLAPHLG